LLAKYFILKLRQRVYALLDKEIAMKKRLALLHLLFVMVFGLAVNVALVASEEDLWGMPYGKYHPENYPELQADQNQDQDDDNDDQDDDNDDRDDD
jgi:hypothetical protein